MRRTFATLAALVVFSTSGAALAASADASPVNQVGQVQVAKPKPKVYKNCDAVHKDYPHGFRKKGAHDVVQGSTTPVPDSKLPVRTPLYKANTARDRDKDGVACEKA